MHHAEQRAATVAVRWRKEMKTLKVSIPNREYEIHIEEGLLERAGAMIQTVFQGKKIALVTDSNVAPLYGAQVTASLEAANYQVKQIVIPAGETSKCREELFRLYDEMLAFGLTRGDLIVALGGGVVGDLTGYAAASLLRGIPFVQIPTTLLAQVDSSVGGKVAIDLPRGKNLVGAFYQPKMVLIDPLCLNTLTDRVFADGMAEVMKYGAIFDLSLFSFLESLKTRKELIAKIGEIVYTCCDWKRQVVEQDELDTGKRMLLNFGHTFGHAIEKEYHYETYTHGEAVGVGMKMAAEYGERQGITPKGTALRIEKLLHQIGLPTRVPMTEQAIKDAMAVDKKGDGNHIHLILLKELGKAEIITVDKESFRLES